ncbi:OLC1v1033596C1 [Oldenlandia corymbosa var. corymbosa]|uniref:OLC1v1033596C1 n=1 Tax=Oldenlandia corymbosa var. corymbosa TaxID=529605 RepID=A0AAV1CPA3_OLDCO|nr:OLC1v1033596C1 [Oldenlandia corymbosa var. corymbosa]
MPCLDIATNVNIDGVDIDSFFSVVTSTVAAIMGKPQNFVMVVLRGSVPIHFGGNKEPAALAEIISLDAVDREVKRKLIAEIGSILQDKLCVPRTRFLLKVHKSASTPNHTRSKL